MKGSKLPLYLLGICFLMMIALVIYGVVLKLSDGKKINYGEIAEKYIGKSLYQEQLRVLCASDDMYNQYKEKGDSYYILGSDKERQYVCAADKDSLSIALQTKYEQKYLLGEIKDSEEYKRLTKYNNSNIDELMKEDYSSLEDKEIEQREKERKEKLKTLCENKLEEDLEYLKQTIKDRLDKLEDGARKNYWINVVDGYEYSPYCLPNTEE